MIPLPEEIKLSGTGSPAVTAHLLRRQGNVCLYSRNDGYFEVFTVKIKPDREFKDRNYPAHEAYPGNEDFGKTAWCYRDVTEAEKRFRNLSDTPKTRTISQELTTDTIQGEIVRNSTDVFTTLGKFSTILETT